MYAKIVISGTIKVNLVFISIDQTESFIELCSAKYLTASMQIQY